MDQKSVAIDDYTPLLGISLNKSYRKAETIIPIKTKKLRFWE